MSTNTKPAKPVRVLTSSDKLRSTQSSALFAISLWMVIPTWIIVGTPIWGTTLDLFGLVVCWVLWPASLSLGLASAILRRREVARHWKDSNPAAKRTWHLSDRKLRRHMAHSLKLTRANHDLANQIAKPQSVPYVDRVPQEMAEVLP